jgi:hypothetical protein
MITVSGRNHPGAGGPDIEVEIRRHVRRREHDHPDRPAFRFHTESIFCMVYSKRGVMEHSGFVGGNAPRSGASRGIARVAATELALGSFPGVELSHIADGIDR